MNDFSFVLLILIIILHYSYGEEIKLSLTKDCKNYIETKEIENEKE